MELARLVLPVPGGPTKHRIGARASAPLKRRTARYCTMRSFTCSKKREIAYVTQGRGLKSTCVVCVFCKLVALEMLRLLTFTGCVTHQMQHMKLSSSSLLIHLAQNECCTNDFNTRDPFVFHMMLPLANGTLDSCFVLEKKCALY